MIPWQGVVAMDGGVETHEHRQTDKFNQIMNSILNEFSIPMFKQVIDTLKQAHIL